MRKTLCIGDAHADPRFSNERFTALGNFIVATQPDYIVEFGDFGNLDSISFHDRGKPLLQEGMRLSDDIASMQDAHNRMMGPMLDYNDKRAVFKKKQYKPIMKKLEGNHENRAFRYLVEVPELAGFLPTTDFVNAANDGWDIVRYKQYTYHEGIAFTHAPMNPQSNFPIGGKYVNHRALEGQQQTIAYGHTHKLQINSIKRNNASGGQTIQAINVGCFFDYDPHYIRGNETQLDWWKGIVIMSHVGDGEVDLETISIDRLKSEFL